MPNANVSLIEHRLHSLESHLREENPVLVDVVRSFREVDDVGRRLGFMSPEQSYASRVPWWPIISILGTYSSGKSTFLNDYLGFKLQLTGNQAVDDKFTVVTFSNEDTVRVLPGLALDADPRFPFYKISREIEEVAAGEGRRIDAYLQLKTCPADHLRAKIFIDSPGFDADEQRTAVLRITNYIIGLSDLVMVFFDARHPETGTMQDTLRHLVEETIHRQDSTKFLYVLNQVDTTAREDNAEDVVASWERALAQKGLTAGRFYRIYSKTAAVPIDDPNIRSRYESKRDVDLKDIDTRIRQVSVDRAYRIVGTLERNILDLETKVVPRLQEMLRSWRSRVLWGDVVAAAVIIAAVIGGLLWSGVSLAAPPEFLRSHPVALWAVVIVIILGAGYLHFRVRKWAANRIIARLRRTLGDHEYLDNYVAAFRKNTRFFRSIFQTTPAGWGPRTREALNKLMVEAGDYVQRLNDTFTNPSGSEEAQAPAPAGRETPRAEPAQSAASPAAEAHLQPSSGSAP